MKRISILAALLTSTALSAQLDGSWAPLSGRDGSTPPPSGYESLVTLLQNQEVLAFATGETWIFDGTNWSQRATSGPAARFGFALAFDPQRQRAVLFGGADLNGNLLDETWEFDGTTWTRIPTSQSPGARQGAGMAYESNSARVVLFGGVDASDTILGGTWTFDGTDWTLESPASAPADRSRPAMVAALGTGVVMFGGRISPTDQLADTFFWNGTDWTEVLVAPGSAIPPARSGAGFAFDVFGNRAILVAGVRNSTVTLPGFPNGVQVLGLEDSWSFDLATLTWTEFATDTSLGRSIDRAASFDPVGSQVLLRSADNDRTYVLRNDFPGLAQVASRTDGCGGPLAFEIPTLASLAGDLPRPGVLMTLRTLTTSPTTSFVTFLVGRSDQMFENRMLPIDLTEFGLAGYSIPGVALFSCQLGLAPDIAVSSTVFSGFADLSFTIPTNPALIGTEVFFQGLAPESGGVLSNGVGSTNVVRLTVGN